MARLSKDTHIKNLLMLRFEWLEDALAAAAQGTPYENVTRTESRVLSHLHYLNMSSAELGRVLAISPQAAHRTVTRLINKGWLVSAPHPTHKRVKVIRPSPAIVRHAFGKLDQIEDRIAKKIGRKRLELLREILSEDWG